MPENVRDTWRTPRWLFDALNAKHHFTHDAAASDSNHLLPMYWTRRDDALSLPWGGKRPYINPPYTRGNDVGAWLKKGVEADVAVYLLPARTDTKWFAWAVEHAHMITFIGGRINHVPPEGVKKSSNFERTMVIEIRNGGTGTSIVQCVPRELLGYRPTRKGKR